MFYRAFSGHSGNLYDEHKLMLKCCVFKTINEFIGAPTYIGTSVSHGVFIADILVIRILLIGAPLIYTSDNNIHKQ